MLANSLILEIKNLHANAGDTKILKGVNLKVNVGEMHVIMGPNASGKSTLARVLAGHPDYTVTAGEVIYEGRSLLELPPEERAREGLFLAFQYPYTIPGVTVAGFMKAAYNALRQHRGLEEVDAVEFLQIVKEKLKIVEMDQSYLQRAVNDGFSGGEKKRNEILQMAVLDPKLAILDETDSGLDIDALKIVANGVNKLMNPSKAILLITHYQRVLNYIIPDYVHVLLDGRIVESGGKELAMELEAHGYDWVREQVENGQKVGG
ncbi:MAG: Fe-S cluster assembly ATPase SufC [Dehalococcoidia bacterium]